MGGRQQRQQVIRPAQAAPPMEPTTLFHGPRVGFNINGPPVPGEVLVYVAGVLRHFATIDDAVTAKHAIRYQTVVLGRVERANVAC